MSQQTGGEERRAGLFSALKNMIATVIAIGKTRAELLVTELEEEKYRLMSLWSKAIGAAFLLSVGIIMAVFGYAAGTGSEHKLIIALCLLLLFYLKSTYEEKQLMKQYPTYADYSRRTGRFFPKLF